MGLDMYLKKRIYFGLDYEHNIKEDEETKIVINGVEQPTKDLSDITYASVYWRKANQIHQFFVENVQDGKDDCTEHYVCQERLEELLDRCKKVKASLEASEFEESDEEDIFTKEKFKYKIFKNTEVAEELLPSTPGFFFGNTDYNNHYLDDINHTITELERILSSDDIDDASFYYKSSW